METTALVEQRCVTVRVKLMKVVAADITMLKSFRFCIKRYSQKTLAIFTTNNTYKMYDFYFFKGVCNKKEHGLLPVFSLIDKKSNMIT